MHPLMQAGWARLKGEVALLAPAGSMATPGGDQLKGVPIRTPQRARQLLMVANETSPAIPAGDRASIIARQNSGGQMPVPRQRQGLSQLWIDRLEPMPISAVPPQIRKSLYQPLSHGVGLYPMNDKWYPIALNANTKNDVRWSTGKPPTAIAGNSPNGTIQSARPQFRRAWKVPRYSTQPDVVIPRSGNSGPGGVAP